MLCRYKSTIQIRWKKNLGHKVVSPPLLTTEGMFYALENHSSFAKNQADVDIAKKFILATLDSIQYTSSAILIKYAGVAPYNKLNQNLALTDLIKASPEARETKLTVSSKPSANPKPKSKSNSTSSTTNLGLTDLIKAASKAGFIVSSKPKSATALSKIEKKMANRKKYKGIAIKNKKRKRDLDDEEDVLTSKSEDEDESESEGDTSDKIEDDKKHQMNEFNQSIESDENSDFIFQHDYFDAICHKHGFFTMRPKKHQLVLREDVSRLHTIPGRNHKYTGLKQYICNWGKQPGENFDYINVEYKVWIDWLRGEIEWDKKGKLIKGVPRVRGCTPLAPLVVDCIVTGLYPIRPYFFL